MERRSKLRFEVHQPISAKVLSTGGKNQIVHGTLENISGSGLRVVSETSLPSGTALQINLPDSMILAEVRYCEPLEPHSLRPEIPRYSLGLEMKQVLNNMGELGRLMQGIMGQSAATDAVRK